MSDENDGQKAPSILSPLLIAALVAAALPLTFSMSSGSTRTVNGVVVESTFTDPVAIGGGALAILFALLFAIVGAGPALRRWIIALIVMVVGARHLTHGLGISLFPSGGASTATKEDTAPAPDCDEDTPGPCQALCDKGDGEACDELGVALDNGKGGLEQDHLKALAAFEKACAAGFGNGCGNAAVLLTSGRVPEEGEKAFGFAKKGCDLKVRKACNELGVMLDNGEGTARDGAAALAAFEQACAAKYAAGCRNAGIVLRDGRASVDVDLAKAVERFEKGCTGGDGGACNELALAYEGGEGVEKDLKRAAEFYEKACQLDSVIGCSNLGITLRDGTGVEKNDARAAKAFEFACDHDDGRACDNLGLLTMAGSGVTKDEAAARRLFIAACDDGARNGCTNAGITMVDGVGGPKDVPDGVRYLRKGCELDSPKACARLGLELAASEPVEARPLLDAACKSNFSGACAALKKLGKAPKGGKKPGKKK